MFRKPKKPIARRVFSAHSDTEENDDEKMDTSSPPPPSAARSAEKLEKSKKRETSRPTKPTLLSFADEEEADTEVFQVKKSSQSKKVMKMLDKERRKKKRGEQYTSSSAENNNGGADNHQQQQQHRPFSSSSYRGGGGDEDPLPSQQTENEKNAVVRKREAKSTNSAAMKNDKDSHKIQTEIRTDDFVLVVKKSAPDMILNGRAALCAGRNDMSSEEEEDSGSEDPTGHKFSQPDKFKMMLESGVIPDAAMIHAARKRRQMARELGGGAAGADFIPVEEKKEEVKKGKRLVREGEGDDSGEEEERVDMSAITGQKELEERREKFYQAQERDSGDESDLEMNEWENQQIRKGVTGAQLMSAQQESAYAQQYLVQSFTSSFTNVAKAVEPPPLPAKDLSTADLLQQAYAKCSFTKPKYSAKATTAAAAKESSRSTGPQKPEEIAKRVAEKLATTKELHRKHLADIERLTTDMIALKFEAIDCEQRAPITATNYRFYQELSCYFRDLVECLNEKVPQINALEQHAITVIGKFAVNLIERRRQDVKDQAKDLAEATRVGAAATSVATTKKSALELEERVRRAAEREGRRTRRRRDREKLNVNDQHLDGMSSDDEVHDQEAAAYRNSLLQIQVEAAQVFEDTTEEFCQLRQILERFEEWKQTRRGAYNDAFVSICIPKAIGPLIRLRLVTWNPLDEACADFEKSEWYEDCIKYAIERDEGEEALANDPDSRLVPVLVEKIILPKLTALVDGVWDPLSTSQTFRLVKLLHRLGHDYPSLRPGCKTLRALFTAILDKLKLAVENDVFIPIFPKQSIEGRSTFFQRQFCSGLKLFRNILSFQGIIADEALKQLAILSVLNRYLLLGMRACSPTDAASKAHTIVYTLPRVWLQPDSSILPSLDKFVEVVKHINSNLDKKSPLHFSSVDKIQSIMKSLYATL